MPSQLFRFILNKTVAKIKNIPVAASFGILVYRIESPRWRNPDVYLEAICALTVRAN
jgi:hypothetical protein